MDQIGETCKLCLKYIQGDSLAALDEDLLSKLDFIQMDLDRSVEESNSVCSECKEKIQNAFDFKFCLVQSESSGPGASESQAQNICDIPSTSSGESSTEKTICRLCKNYVAVISVISLEKLLKDDNVMEVFQGHIPEMELNGSENSMVCEPCQKSLASFSMLVSSWLTANDWNEDEMKEDMDIFGAVEVKKEDEDQFSDSNTNSSCAVDASDSGKIVKRAKGNLGQVTKVKTEGDEESNSSESVSVNSKDVKKEGNEEEDKGTDLQLKDEEIDIKDEEGKRLAKSLSTNQSTGGPNIQSIKRYRCSLCPFTATYRCQVRRHFLVHKSIDEVETFQCQQCPYVAKCLGYLKKHEIVHKQVMEIRMYPCLLCDYTTKKKSNLTVHQLKHKRLDEVETVKCDQCPFETKYKRCLKNHLQKHKNFEEVLTYSCVFCPFRTRYRHGIKCHIEMKHQSNEVQCYRCENCPFYTKYKSSLKKHSIYCMKKLCAA